MVGQALDVAGGGWVLSGSLDGWGDPLIPRFEQVVFLSAPTDVRLARLQVRERQRYGDAIAPGGPLEAQHRDFLAFAEGYDTGVFTSTLAGRHRARHEAWLTSLRCPVLRLDGRTSTTELVDEILASRGQTGGPWQFLPTR